MSHFTKMTTKLLLQKYVEQALKVMGRRFETGKVVINGYQGNKNTIEDGIKVYTESPKYDIGLEKKDGSFDITADWYGLGGEEGKKTFVDSLNQNYGLAVVKGMSKKSGFKVISEKNKNGTIKIKLKRTV